MSLEQAVPSLAFGKVRVMHSSLESKLVRAGAGAGKTTMMVNTIIDLFSNAVAKKQLNHQ